jgi:hypothetical protein
MPIDPNIPLQVKPLQLNDPLAQYAQVSQIQSAQNQNELAKYTISKAKREDERTNQLLERLSGAKTNEDILNAYKLGGYGKEAIAIGKDLLAQERTKGQIAAQGPALELANLNLLDKNLDQFKTQIPNIQTVEQAEAYTKQLYANPVTGAYASKIKPLDQALVDNRNEFTANPEKWRMLHTNVTGMQILQALQIKPQAFGGNLVNINPVAGQVGTPIAGAPYNPQSPTGKLQADLAAAKAANAPPQVLQQIQNAINHQTVIEQQGAQRNAIGQAGLALRNRELDPYGMFPPIGVGGGYAASANTLAPQPRPVTNALTPQAPAAAPVAAPVVAPTTTGKMTVADAFKNNVTGPDFVAVLPPTVKPLVESILRYDQRPPSPATKRGQQILELVNQADPTYDSSKAQTRYIAKQTFVKGPVADSIASTNTAIDHMDTLAKYGADLNNSDVRLANAARQGIAAAFGKDAPTTFDATRRIVGQEVVKAVVANGGSMREREEAADAFNKANSPAQLAGVIKSYQALLSGRLKSTQLRYENDTGLKDFQTKLTPATQRALNVTGSNQTTNAPSVDAVKALKSGAGTSEQFDAIFGAGAAKRALSGGQ